jgi:hypothetical protein
LLGGDFRASRDQVIADVGAAVHGSEASSEGGFTAPLWARLAT